MIHLVLVPGAARDLDDDFDLHASIIVGPGLRLEPFRPDVRGHARRVIIAR